MWEHDMTTEHYLWKYISPVFIWIALIFLGVLKRTRNKLFTITLIKFSASENVLLWRLHVILLVQFLFHGKMVSICPTSHFNNDRTDNERRVYNDLNVFVRVSTTYILLNRDKYSQCKYVTHRKWNTANLTSFRLKLFLLLDQAQ